MLHVFGDSHSQIIGGGIVLDPADAQHKFRNVTVHWLYEALAYNLMDGSGSVGKHGATVLEQLATVPTPSAILLVFGEIDLRTHVLPRSIRAGDAHPEANFRPIARRLADFARLLASRFPCPVFVLAPIPSAPDFQGYSAAMPNTGSERERNFVTHLFRLALHEEAQATPMFHVIDLFDDLTLPGLRTDSRFYADMIHLNYAGLGLFSKAFARLVADYGLNLPDYWAPSELRHRPGFHLRDISRSCRIAAQSSRFDAVNGLTDQTKRGFCFHTLEDDGPFVVIDIGYAALIGHLRLQNRIGYEQRNANLSVEVSLDGHHYRLVHQVDGVFGQDGKPLDVSLAPYAGEVRFIRLSVPGRTFFHLREVTLLEHKLLEF